MTYLKRIEREIVPPKHLCKPPETLFQPNRVDAGSVWQCDCGQVFLLKESPLRAHSWWKKISKKRAAKILGFPVGNKPQKPKIPQDGHVVFDASTHLPKSALFDSYPATKYDEYSAPIYDSGWIIDTTPKLGNPLDTDLS